MPHWCRVTSWTQSSLTKTPGADLREGKLTLPLIHAMRSASDEDRARMETIVGQDAFSDDEFDFLTRLLRECGGLSYTRGMAERYSAKAKEALSVFEDSPSRRLLFMINDYVLARNA